MTETCKSQQPYPEHGCCDCSCQSRRDVPVLLAFQCFNKVETFFSNIPKSCFTLSSSHPGVLILGPWQSSGSHEAPRKADPKSSLWKRSHLLVLPSDLVLWRTLKRLASGSEPHSDMLCSYSPNPVQSCFYPAVCAFLGFFSHCCKTKLPTSGGDLAVTCICSIQIQQHTCHIS